MRPRILLLFIAVVSLALACGPDPGPLPGGALTPPVARAIPHQLEAHGRVRTDEYYWLRERVTPEVLAYLEAENAYTDAVMAPTEALQETLFAEIRDRIPQTDETVPYLDRGWYYYTRWEEGKSYSSYCRRRAADAPEEVVLDVNAEAEGHEFYSVGDWDVSPDGRMLAWAEDTTGRRFHTIRLRNLETGENLPDAIPDVTDNFCWAEDNLTFFYTKQDPLTLRAFQVYRHVLGTDSSADELVFEETDETFSCDVHTSKSRRYVVIGCEQTLSTEYRLLDAARPGGEFRVVLPRERGHEYHIASLGDWLYIRTNDGAKNFRLVRAPADNPGRDQWEELVPHREDVLFEGLEISLSHLVLRERRRGLPQLRVLSLATGEEHLVSFEEPAYEVYPRDNRELDSPVLRFHYSSLTTPDSVFDYDFVTRERTLMKRDEIHGGFDPANYRTERLFAPAADGREIPVSLVYRRELECDGSRPLLLYGYGSYGHSLDAGFMSELISLLDRGFVYALAHVRGGEELGRWWYEEGKLLKKKNTFSDFIACAEHLVAEGYTSPERLFAEGGSAGGLLIGAVINMRPELFHGVIAAVPFVDVVTTMIDDDIPLTTGEFDEWGNPDEPEYYDYLLSYSPYDNVTARAYPHILVTTAYQDSQVQYWEPAKWVARLRAKKTGDKLLLLKTRMDAGHGGSSGRFKKYRETAFDYAFLLRLAGCSPPHRGERRIR